ncbi:hypothetical protein OG534_38040 (plasmid) [Streptomyces sp. NBC_01294]|nr:hypothetical protein OG534_38040 [Streptomyces sp. NBC_01294]
MCPESSAWATKARLEQARVIAAANAAAAVRSCAPCGSCRLAPYPRPAGPTPPRHRSHRRPLRCSDGPRLRATAVPSRRHLHP